LTKLETHQAKPRWAHSWATLSPVIGSLLRRFVGSKSFPSCLPASRYARPRLPSSGSLGSHFPTFTGTTLGYDYQLFFSMPYALARSPIPCLFPFVRVPFPARYRSGTLALTPGLLGLPVRLFRVAHKETTGSPKFPGYPLELMPCSSTPVVSSALAFAHSGLLPSATMTTSAFPSKKTDGYPLSTIIQISRLNHTACFLALLGFRLPLPDLPARFTTALLARL